MAINLIVASGNIGKDCETRSTPGGKLIASFSLPIKQGYGEHEKTSWVTCRLFGVKAEKLPQYLTKGMKVTVTGEFVLEKWTGQDGIEKTAPVIIVNDVDFNSARQERAPGKPSQRQNPPQHGNGKSTGQPPMDFDEEPPF